MGYLIFCFLVSQIANSNLSYIGVFFLYYFLETLLGLFGRFLGIFRGCFRAINMCIVWAQLHHHIYYKYSRSYSFIYYNMQIHFYILFFSFFFFSKKKKKKKKKKS